MEEGIRDQLLKLTEIAGSLAHFSSYGRKSLNNEEMPRLAKSISSVLVAAFLQL